jgi:hypothetical protein
MNLNHRALSDVREVSPYATPPRVLVMADDADAGQAVALMERLESIGADVELRFVSGATGDHRNQVHADAVIVAGKRGYRITQHHPVLEAISHLSS